MCMIGMMCHDVFFFPFQLAVGIALFLPDHVQVCQWAQVSLERWAASAPAQTGQTQGTQTQHVFSCFLVQTARHRWKKSIGTDIDNWIYVVFLISTNHFVTLQEPSASSTFGGPNCPFQYLPPLRPLVPSHIRSCLQRLLLGSNCRKCPVKSLWFKTWSRERERYNIYRPI